MPITGHGVWVVMVMAGELNWEGVGTILQCWEGLAYMQLYQNPLFQPGSQAITSPGNSYNSASHAPLSPFPPHHERTTATNGIQEHQDLGLIKTQMGFNLAVGPWVNCQPT